jgi:hypothetical protein
MIKKKILVAERIRRLTAGSALSRIVFLPAAF